MKTGLNILRISVTALRQLMSHVNILNTMEVGAPSAGGGDISDPARSVLPVQTDTETTPRVAGRPGFWYGLSQDT